MFFTVNDAIKPKISKFKIINIKYIYILHLNLSVFTIIMRYIVEISYNL